jgi:hypothetical protein
MNQQGETMINVSGATKEAAEAVKVGILEILNSRADQKTIRLALQAYTKSLVPSHITIEGCSFTATYPIEPGEPELPEPVGKP